MEVVGSIASIAQLVEGIYKLTGGVISLVDGFQNCSEELRRVKLAVQSFKVKLEVLNQAIGRLSIEIRLTPGVLDCFKVCLLEVQTDVEAIANIIKRYHTVQHAAIPVRKKLLYLSEQKTLERCLKHLGSSENNLQRIESTIHLYLTMLMHREIYIRSHGLSSGMLAARAPKVVPSAARSRSSLLHSRSLMRSHGLYSWHISEEKQLNTYVKNTWCVGLCLPSWLTFTLISLTVTLIIANLKDGPSLQWGLRIQNRVPLTSPLMRACQAGDVTLIRQIIGDKRGGVNDRSICRGITPLIVTLRGGHFEATKFLLENGADPNIPDDDQVSPLFAVAGMNPQAHSFFEQLPPTWDRWFDSFHLLVTHGAEVHERVRGRSLASLNVEVNDRTSRTLEFLRLLAVEDSLQLDATSEFNGWPALHNALACDSTAVDALKVMHSSGIRLSKITEDGRSALHISARVSTSAAALEYLCTVGCGEHINRQDQWGWTPLHYAVAARNSAEVLPPQKPFSKVVMLLRAGADPAVQSSRNALEIYEPQTERFNAFEYLQQVRPTRFRSLVQTLRVSGFALPIGQDEDVFYDCT